MNQREIAAYFANQLTSILLFVNENIDCSLMRNKAEAFDAAIVYKLKLVHLIVFCFQ